MQSAATDETLAWLGNVLSHPLRVGILREMTAGRASPKELADRLDEPLTSVSYHVRILAQAGAIKPAGTTPRRGAIKHYYVLQDGIAAVVERVQGAIDGFRPPQPGR